MLKIIAAIDKNRGIGRNNELLFRIPADLQRFKQLTLGHTVVMGRKTYESIGHPLPGRDNIILTRNHQFASSLENVSYDNTDGTSLKIICACDGQSAVDNIVQCTQNNHDRFIIGGAEIYETFLPYANELLLTQVEQSYQADSFFPQWNIDQWTLAEHQGPFHCEIDGGNLEYAYLRYLRIKPNII
jgi:dihydrofolate reductase